MERAVIVEALRTPIGKFLGGLSSVPAPQLAASVSKAVIERTGIDPGGIDEVIMGNVLQAGLGQNPARQAAIFAGIPPKVGAMTINKVCGSGLKSIALAAQAIKAGDAETILAGGMESMSRAPYMLLGARTGQRLGHDKLIDVMIHDGLWDHYNDYHMGITGELVAEKYSVTREQQDQHAFDSQRKAVAAMQRGAFKSEIAPVSIPQKKGDPVVVDADEGPRGDVTVESLAKLKPAFKKDGTVTAGNASTINDGAAAVLVMSEKRAAKLGLPIVAVIDAYATGGLEPQWVMMAPVEAVKNLLAGMGGNVDQFDLIELNEAFSAQAVAVMRELKLPADRVNVNGGAVALGHPIGASGARILETLIHAMKERNAKKGLATLCLGGGNAVAMAVSRV
ncbi:MAG: acetyl-CoA C-acetyltransferase [Chitinivibrionia bacterium]|nr:acetyl-CoA C-acetyltransferase [Chitinivibrionia bacterium]